MIAYQMISSLLNSLNNETCLSRPYYISLLIFIISEPPEEIEIWSCDNIVTTW